MREELDHESNCIFHPTEFYTKTEAKLELSYIGATPRKGGAQNHQSYHQARKGRRLPKELTGGGCSKGQTTPLPWLQRDELAVVARRRETRGSQSQRPTELSPCTRRGRPQPAQQQ
jgi:hypothetical protein